MRSKILYTDFMDIFVENDDDLAEQEIILKDQTPVRIKYYNTFTHTTKHYQKLKKNQTNDGSS